MTTLSPRSLTSRNNWKQKFPLAGCSLKSLVARFHRHVRSTGQFTCRSRTHLKDKFQIVFRIFVLSGGRKRKRNSLNSAGKCKTLDEPTTRQVFNLKVTPIDAQQVLLFKFQKNLIKFLKLVGGLTAKFPTH